jgi:hypothetical protein
MKEIYNFLYNLHTEQNSKCRKYIKLPSKIQINVTSVQGNCTNTLSLGFNTPLQGFHKTQHGILTNYGYSAAGSKVTTF